MNTYRIYWPGCNFFWTNFIHNNHQFSTWKPVEIAKLNYLVKKCVHNIWLSLNYFWNYIKERPENSQIYPIGCKLINFTIFHPNKLRTWAFFGIPDLKKRRFSLFPERFPKSAVSHRICSFYGNFNKNHIECWRNLSQN